ncbi:MAG: hypothetical protein KJO88_04375 [Gammaproteobacteria bacterium]|nr:hypothetical protein [Gammaproteobacteria bacterium]NNM12945.1 hypothetical protein [Gammaproteobacteria bacterium]
MSKILQCIAHTLVFLLLMACTYPNDDAQSDPSSITECGEKRPKACTKEYKPVCATKDNGVRCVTTPCDSSDQVSYANACLACADTDVYHYIQGQCENDKTTSP